MNLAVISIGPYSQKVTKLETAEKVDYYQKIYTNKWIVNYAMRNIRPRLKSRSVVISEEREERWHFSLILNKFA